MDTRRLQVRAPTGVYAFELNRALVEEAMQEVGDAEIARSIEAALIAALDYCRWQREVQCGERDVRE
ncbi:MAG: hypothetical protein ACRELV_03315 [Longimicrobiales bacterium]